MARSPGGFSTALALPKDVRIGISAASLYKTNDVIPATSHENTGKTEKNRSPVWLRFAVYVVSCFGVADGQPLAPLLSSRASVHALVVVPPQSIPRSLPRCTRGTDLEISREVKGRSALIPLVAAPPPTSSPSFPPSESCLLPTAPP